jgi:hypothetical protein
MVEFSSPVIVIFFYLFIFYVCMVLGFELRALCLRGSHSTTWATTSALCPVSTALIQSFHEWLPG